jgi:pimeloyl-[acyl-carrier protein] methyl ester esterase
LIELVDAQIVLLPGLDGTGKLFKRFIAAAPPDVSVTAIALPPQALDYAELADYAARSLPDGEGLVLVAESFSGPLRWR